MKKVFLILMLLCMMLLYVFQRYHHQTTINDIKDFLGIQSIKKIEILKKGSTRIPPSDYMILKLGNTISRKQLNNYKKTTPGAFGLSSKYFQLNKPAFYIKKYTQRKGVLYQEALIQGRNVFYNVVYTN